LAVLKEHPVKALPFTKKLGFRKVVNERAEAYFKENNLRPRDVPEMYVKSLVLLALYVASYVAVLVVGSTGTPWVLAFYVWWGLVVTGLGFNTMHDAIHGGYSDSQRRNRIIGLAIELLGASGFEWKQKHNVWHHTYTNVAGLDEDLETQGAFRFSPHEDWQPHFRWQHLYSPFVYGMTGFSFLIRDFRVFFTGHSDAYHVYPKMNAKERTIFLGGKAMFFLITLIVPMLVMPWYFALIGWALFVITISLTLASIFQLAHVMEPCTFPEPVGDPLHIENEWAIHEVETTVDFGPGNRFLNWYCGGLNFQIEHHLFPLVCHVHYPALAKIVKQTCAEFGVQYNVFPTWRGALMSHLRILRDLGRKPASEPARPEPVSVPRVAK
jgi:linoleoyl-CoA desaturase